MEARVANFPRSGHDQWGEETEFYDVRYNVKKTDSLSAPIIGIVTFKLPGLDVFEFEIIFHWRGEQWVFSDSRCLNLRVNHEAWDAFAMRAPEIASWIVHGTVRPDDVAGRMKQVAIDKKDRERRDHELVHGPATPKPQPGSWMYDRRRRTGLD